MDVCVNMIRNMCLWQRFCPCVPCSIFYCVCVWFSLTWLFFTRWTRLMASPHSSSFQEHMMMSLLLSSQKKTVQRVLLVSFSECPMYKDVLPILVCVSVVEYVPSMCWWVDGCGLNQSQSRTKTARQLFGCSHHTTDFDPKKIPENHKQWVDSEEFHQISTNGLLPGKPASKQEEKRGCIMWERPCWALSLVISG